MRDTKKTKTTNSDWTPEWDWSLGNQYGFRKTLVRRDEAIKKKNFKSFRIEPMSTTLGAEIFDIDLKEPLTTAVKEEFTSALALYRVVVFREQHLSREELYTLGTQIGEPNVNPLRNYAKKEAKTDIVLHNEQRNSVENVWHIDETWRDIPPWLTMIQIKDCPRGGDTLFADLESIYQGLPPDIKALLENVYCEYDHRCWLSQPMFANFDQKKILSQFPPIQHPIILKHPITGNKQLYFSPTFLSKLVGLPKGVDQNEIIMRLLWEVSTPEYQCRVSWNSGDIGLFDNYANIHYASFDYWPRQRTIDRMGIQLPIEYQAAVKNMVRAGKLA